MQPTITTNLRLNLCFEYAHDQTGSSWIAMRQDSLQRISKQFAALGEVTKHQRKALLEQKRSGSNPCSQSLRRLTSTRLHTLSNLTRVENSELSSQSPCQKKTYRWIRPRPARHQFYFFRLPMGTLSSTSKPSNPSHRHFYYSYRG